MTENPSTTYSHTSLNSYYDLWVACKEFIVSKKITCTDDVYQRVQPNAFVELGEKICEIVGYYSNEA
jgi:hypothetical protein